jgi:hypothetical protein
VCSAVATAGDNSQELTMLRVAQDYDGSGTFGDTIVYKRSGQQKVQMAEVLLMRLFGSQLFQAHLCLLPSICSLSK